MYASFCGNVTQLRIRIIMHGAYSDLWNDLSIIIYIYIVYIIHGTFYVSKELYAQIDFYSILLFIFLVNKKRSKALTLVDIFLNVVVLVLQLYLRGILQSRRIFTMWTLRELHSKYIVIWACRWMKNLNHINEWVTKVECKNCSNWFGYLRLWNGMLTCTLNIVLFTLTWILKIVKCHAYT